MRLKTGDKVQFDNVVHTVVSTQSKLVWVRPDEYADDPETTIGPFTKDEYKHWAVV